jgi:phenylacetyl-CoA:acceptor oxidoreductase 26-kDa subunit
MSRPQRHWDARAALNFILGGSGAGLTVASVAIVPASPWPLALALAFIAAGLAAVWLEIGRKARALHVFFNPFTSWMTRESFAALLLFPLALGSMLSLRFVPAAALAALVFLWCQARILRAARGVPAWRVREIVPLVICTGLAEGAGLALFFSQERWLLVWFAIAVTARALAWTRYRAAAKSAALESAGRTLLYFGTAGALACALAGTYLAPLAWVAAIAAIATGWNLKFVLVTRASAYAGFGLPHLPVRGTR